MATLVEILLHPDRRHPDPEPLQLPTRRVIAIGTLAWAVFALGTALLVRGAHSASGALRTAAAGAMIGILWWAFELWRERRRAVPPRLPENPIDPN